MTTTDAPYYDQAPDGWHIHICRMPGHSRVWLNVDAGLWICARCHPAAGEVRIEEVGVVMGEKERDANTRD